MPKFAANLSMLFTEVDFLDRFETAASHGFSAVEFLFPYDFPASIIKEKLHKHHLKQALFNAPAGNWQAGERGTACLPGREREFINGFNLALEYAEILGNQRIHVMAGIAPENASKVTIDCYINNLRRAAIAAQDYGITVLIEPINNIDMPGYFLNYQEQAVDLIKQIDQPNVKLQFDVYHCQMMQGNVLAKFEKALPYIDHMQIAGVPGRHEPDIGELNYSFILSEIEKLGFQGFIGCEYLPQSSTCAGLGWLKAFN
jgi:hydroxypyruvate isomerase